MDQEERDFIIKSVWVADEYAKRASARYKFGGKTVSYHELLHEMARGSELGEIILNTFSQESRSGLLKHLVKKKKIHKSDAKLAEKLPYSQYLDTILSKMDKPDESTGWIAGKTDVTYRYLFEDMKNPNSQFREAQYHLVLTVHSVKK